MLRPPLCGVRRLSGPLQHHRKPNERDNICAYEEELLGLDLNQAEKKDMALFECASSQRTWAEQKNTNSPSMLFRIAMMLHFF